MIQKTVETCSSTVAICAISAWAMDILEPVVIILSIIWLALQIGWFTYSRYKEWRKKS